MTSPYLVVNQSQLASILDVSAKTLQQWDRDGLRDVARLESSGRDAKYDVPAALRWWRDREIARALEPYSSSLLEEERRRWVSAKASKAELELATIRGELVHINVMRRKLSAVFSRVRARLLAMKGTLPPRITGLDTPREALAIVGPEVDRVLGELLEVTQPGADQDDG